ncbi:hypothetical protein ACOME3_000257 [Neoechinorhynchus agilis]
MESSSLKRSTGNGSDAPKLSEEMGVIRRCRADYIQHRLKVWDRLKSEQVSLEAKKITVTITNASDEPLQVSANTHNCPLDVLRSHAPKLSKEVVVVTVDGNELWDVQRPFEDDCTIEAHTYKDSKGKEVCLHSSAHILGQAMELAYGGDLCYEQTIETGFYYDMFIRDGGTISGKASMINVQ